MSARLTAVLPNYNDAALIGRALDALLAQSAPPAEVVVVDDGSTDDSPAVIREWMAAHPEIRLVRHGENRGVAAALASGLAAAAGDYVYLASADDVVLPGFFERALARLEACPQAALCFSDMVTVDRGTGTFAEFPLRVAAEPRCLGPDELVAALRAYPFVIASTTAVFRTAALRAAGGLDPGLAWNCDWFAALAAGLEGGVAYLPEGLALFTVEAGGFSARRHRWAEHRRVLLALLERMAAAEPPRLRARLRRAAALPAYDARLLPAIAARPRLWHLLSPLLVRRLVAASAVALAVRWSPAALKRAYRRRRPRERERGTPVACRPATRARLRAAGLASPPDDEPRAGGA